MFLFLLLDVYFKSLRRKAQTEKAALEKEIAALKSQKDSLPSKKMDELRKQNTDLQAQIDSEVKKTSDVTSKYEQLEEQHVFIKAQLSSDKETLEATNNALKAKIVTLEANVERFKRDNIDLSRKIVDVQTKCKDFESKSSQNVVVEHERQRLLASLQEKSHQYELLVSENEMNKDLSEQLKKEVRKWSEQFLTRDQRARSALQHISLPSWHSFGDIIPLRRLTLGATRFTHFQHTST